MQNFRNILFVSHGLEDESQVIEQALRIARYAKGELRALIVCPEFPADLAQYREKYESSLRAELTASIQVARRSLGLGETDFPVPADIDSGHAPAVRIVRRVLKEGHDLVIKEAEDRDGATGFMAVDMELLRKCPCPVWLSRPGTAARGWGEMTVAVAIDPLSMTPEGNDLSIRLLQLSRSLADTCDGELRVISCWDYEFEAYLRGSVWIKMQDDELMRTVAGAQRQHRAALTRTINRSGIGGQLQVNHLRGRPEQVIPRFVAVSRIDILVMGTVARTGIRGFVFGNTAENVVQKLACSLLALKPNGFVSPVKAYG